MPSIDAAAEAEARQQAAPRGDHRQVHLGAVARLQDGAQLAQAVDQARARGRAVPVQNSPVNSGASSPLSLPAAALAHPVLEAVMDLGLQALAAARRPRASRGERDRASTCARPRCARAARRRSGRSGPGSRSPALITPIEPTIERRIGDDLVGGAGQPIAARGRDILDEGDHRQVLLARPAGGCAGRSAPTAPASRRAN